MERLLQTTLFILLVFCGDFALSQDDPDAIEISRCTKYKKDIFEVVQTYGFFTYGAKQNTYIADHCKQSTPFIVNGIPANPKEFPLMARLGHAEKGNETKWFCGGTLISEKFVLTAAHCFHSRNGEVNVVRLGELDFDAPSKEAQDFEVERNIPHPDYSDSTNYDDVALIELKKAVSLNDYIHPACLPELDGDEFAEFIAIGWGSTRLADFVGSKKLQKVKLERFTPEQCGHIVDDAGNSQLTDGLRSDSQLCAGSKEAKDTCNGDSGGPLLAYHRDYPCMYYVVGVTSLGIGGCGTPNVPGIYTRVYNYMDWIKQYIWK